MAFFFPNLDTLRLAITGGIVPPAVSLARGRGGVDPSGEIWIEPAEAAPRNLGANLAKLKVRVAKAPAKAGEPIWCWLQMLPVERESRPPQLTDTTPVLFELPDAGQLPTLAGEMLRLGNDRQGFRWLKPEAEGEAASVLLRVVGPPYYTLLRALDRMTEAGGAPVRAYLEHAPRVWVEVGHSHPLAEQIRPPQGQLLIMRPPRDWGFLAEAPFHDVYEFLDFALPQAPVEWEEVDSGERLTVPLRLAAGGGSDAPEFWVLRRDAVRQLDELVSASNDRLLTRLAFAVAENGSGEPTVVVRVRPGRQSAKLAPPPLVFTDAEGYRPYLRLPNLFVPVGQRIRPPLRRDAVRKLLADDPARVTWLAAGGDGGLFTPESLPESAFRPLEDWVDYVLDRDRKALTAWVGAAEFDFDAFVCKDDQNPAKVKEAPRARSRGKAGAGAGDADEAADVPTVPVVQPPPRGRRSQPDEFAAAPVVTPNELQKRLAEAEKTFLDVDGPLDDPRRLQLWPELAGLYAGLERTSEASLCWMNALWAAARPDPAVVSGWLKTEAQHKPRTQSPAELDALLTDPAVTPPDVRALVAAVVSAGHQGEAPPALRERLPRVQRFLEVHEKDLPVRAVWLGWYHLAQLTGADVLSLARVRDRLYNRLLTDGLSKDRDLPFFLRSAGQNDSERMGAVRSHLRSLHKLAVAWVSDPKDPEPTRNSLPYADLTFAFGLARLGEASAARETAQRAADALAAKRDAVHDILLAAYRYRIDQALAGKPHAGPLPADLLDRINKIDTGAQFKFNLNVLLRLREYSQVLEPQEKVAAHMVTYSGKHDALDNELVALLELHEPETLAGRWRKLLGDGQRRAEDRLRVLAAALKTAPRAGERFTLEALHQVPAMLASAPGLAQADPALLNPWGDLLESGLLLAAFHGEVDLAHKLVPSLLQLMAWPQKENAAKPLDRLVGQCIRSLRKLGLRDEMAALLQQITDLFQGREVLEQLARRPADWKPIEWQKPLRTLRVLLQVGGGWMTFGRLEAALPALDQARRLLFDGDLHRSGSAPFPTEKKMLACTYAGVLGQAPVDFALARIDELFRRLGLLANAWSTKTYFSLFHLSLIEAVVLSIVSDDFTIGPAARRLLDEDEYLVRQRIKRDLQALEAHAGV
jgi:hypothetical protein